MDTKQLITGSPKEGFYPIVQDTVTVIELNEAVMNLTSESSSEDIAAAFDSAASFNTLIEQIRNTENIVNGILMNNDGSVGKIICTIAAYKNQYACDIEYIYDGKIIKLDITNTDGTMSCIRKETVLGGGSQDNIKYISLNDISSGTVNETVTTTLNNLQNGDILIGIINGFKTGFVIDYYINNNKFYGSYKLIDSTYPKNITIGTLVIDLTTKESSLYGMNINTNGDGSKFLSDDGTYKAIEVGDKTNVLILSLENDLANGQKDSPVEAEVSTALKNAITNGKACVIKSANSDILANLQQIGDNVIIVMEQIRRVGQIFVAVNTSITVNTVTNVISDYQTGALVLETGGDGNKFLSNNGEYKEISQPDLSNYLAKDNTTEFTPTGDYQPATKKYVDDKKFNNVFRVNNSSNLLRIENYSTWTESIVIPKNLESGSTLFVINIANISTYDNLDNDILVTMRTAPGIWGQSIDKIISDILGNKYHIEILIKYEDNQNDNDYYTATFTCTEFKPIQRVLTESEYSALGTTPETDNVLYFVTPD